MKLRHLLTSIILFQLVFTLSSAQTAVNKKEITVNDVLEWNNISESIISNDGSFIAVKMEPWKGSATLKLYDNKGKELFCADSSSNAQFTHDSAYLIFRKGSGKKTSRHIYSLKTGEITVVESVKAFDLSSKEKSYILVHKQDSSLVVGWPGVDYKTISQKAISYSTSKDENSILVYEKGLVIKHTVVGSASFLGETKIDTLWKGSKPVSLMALNENGAISSFVTEDKLYVKESNKEIKEVASGVSKFRALNFSPDGSKLYFGLEVAKPQRDTTISKDDFPEVNIWNWNEEIQFPQQLLSKKRDLNASKLAVYNFEKGSWFQIENDFITSSTLVDKGNSTLVIAVSDKNYRLEQMWTGRSRYDVHIIDTYLERSIFALEAIDGMPRLSPASKFIYWYSAPDSSWFSYSLDTKEKAIIVGPSQIAVYDEQNDVPDWPSSYSAAGWSKDDKEFLVYDRYDIWAVDPLGKRSPVNLTGNGREKNITYRYIKTDSQQEFINISGAALLSGFDNTTKGYGYYSKKRLDNISRKDGAIEVVFKGDFMLSTPTKAKNSNAFIFTKETFEQFPDILFTNDNFKNITPITKANPQQDSFIWGKAQLVKWTSHDGVELEGVLYLPENFDPSHKYPMMVNFYDKNSQALHSHRIPEAHRSTIDYHVYNSTGYVIFNPDIVYKDGYPGESAFNAVMPGISKVIEMGFVNPKKIGAQGHSWGGYQVAYLATRTNLFAAIESGAPVVNMFSAYGGMRWGSGINRTFQYEHQQSRIGATPWESPLRYMENSPLFTMDKVTTPILIMHNDQDGHVPWYQGIEYFVSLKRLRKPVWMLNYTGEVHWPQKIKNKADFQIRMKQFFDHFLKDAPAPKWMDPGLSAIELDAQTGY